VKRDLKSFLATVGKRIVIDTGILYEILAGTKEGEIFKEMLFQTPEIGEHWMTDIGFSEIYYLICRSVKKDDFNRIIKELTNLIEISSVTDLKETAGQIKCEFPISLPDCYNIALAEKIKGKAIFKHEKEINKGLEKTNENIDSLIVFIDDFSYFKARLRFTSTT